MIKSTGFANTSVVIHGGMIVVHWVMMRLSGIKSIFCFKRQIQVKMENVTKYTLPLKLFISAFPFLALLLMNYRGNSILCLLQTIWASFAFSISCDTFSVHGTTSCICKLQWGSLPLSDLCQPRKTHLLVNGQRDKDKNPMYLFLAPFVKAFIFAPPFTISHGVQLCLVQAFMQDFPQFNWQQTEIIMENVFSIKYSFCICVFFVYFICNWVYVLPSCFSRAGRIIT